MNIGEWIAQIPNFESMSVANKMLVVGYYLHTVKKLERFGVKQVNLAFDELHQSRPTNTTSQLKGMMTGGDKRILQDAKGFRLSSTARQKIAKLVPSPTTAKQIVSELKILEMRITDPHQKTFLEEAIACFEHGAYRAAIVMAWNLAFHHTCAYIFSGHLTAFNEQLTKAYPKKKTIGKPSDFEDLKESEVIEIAKGAQVISVSTSKVLSEKLMKRNSAAHPSSLVVMPVTADEVISDLVQNILLRPSL